MPSLAHGSWRWDSRLEISFPYNRDLVEAIKSQIDPHYREWSPSTKTWIFDPALGAPTALRLLRFYHPDIEITDSRSTYQEPPPRFRTEPKIDPDFTTLYVLPEAPRCVIDAAFKALAREYHPDRLPAGEREHGHERMVQLNTAYARVVDRIAS